MSSKISTDNDAFVSKRSLLSLEENSSSTFASNQNMVRDGISVQPSGVYLHSDDSLIHKRSSRCKCSKKYQIGICSICVILLTLIALALTYLFGNIPSNCHDNNCKPTGESTNPSSGTKITLLGDSLMTNSYRQFKFADRIRAKIPYLQTHVNQSIIFVDEGVGSDTIARIAKRIDNALSHNSEGLLLFWDSDCSDFSEKGLSTQQVSDMRNKYESNLRYVLDKILAINVTTILGLAGPGLLGENPMFQSPFQTTHWSKEGMLDDYREINKKVCLDYNIKYIDVRSALQKAIPSDWPWSFGAVTLDGEHLNKHGIEVVAQLFANVVNDWLISLNAITTGGNTTTTGGNTTTTGGNTTSTGGNTTSTGGNTTTLGGNSNHTVTV